MPGNQRIACGRIQMAHIGSFVLAIRVVLAAVICPRGCRQGLRPAGHASFAFRIRRSRLGRADRRRVAAGCSSWRPRSPFISRAPLAGRARGVGNCCSASWAGLSYANLRGRAPDCHCFGQLHSAPAGREALVRNGVLAVLAAVVIWRAAPRPVDPRVGIGRTPAELVAVGAVVVALAVSVIALRLWLERRRLREDLAAHGAHRGPPPGLPVGATAPAFAFLTFTEDIQTLSHCGQGNNRSFSVFVGPGCGSCRETPSESRPMAGDARPTASRLP